MTWTRQRAGWIGTGRMGAPMAERPARAGTGRVTEDFAILLDLRAAAAGLNLEPEAVPVDDGLSA